jgi:hypothetical protein
LARTIARTIHPRPSALSSGALKLHTRNIYQIAGPYPNWENAANLSKVVVFCADEEDGKVRGGTRTAVVLAAKNSIPTINIRGKGKDLPSLLSVAKEIINKEKL